MNNITLTDKDWSELERILWHEVGTKEEYNKDFEDTQLGMFVRHITGLSQEAANKAFAEFLDETTYNEGQIYFVKQIIKYVVKNGYIEDKAILKGEEFSPGVSFDILFEDKQDALKDY